MLDITLIENIYIFLTNLETDGFITKDINIKVINKNRNGSYFIKYNNLLDLYNKNKVILDNNKPNRYCQLGDYPFIENIKFENNVSSYLSEFYYYNVTSKTPKVRDKTNFDYKRNAHYDFDKSKYKVYLNDSLITNLNNNIDLANTRLSSYVDVCYIDTNYVGDIPRVSDSIENDF